MAGQRRRLTQSMIEEAAQAIRAGRHTPGMEWRERMSGLNLRFNATSASYFFRDRSTSIKLGELRFVDSASDDTTAITLDAARHLASEVKRAIAQGRDPKSYIRAFREHRQLGQVSEADAHVAATHASAGAALKGDGPWRWRDLVDAFLEWKLPRIGERYGRNYETYLRNPAFKTIEGKRLPELKFLDLFRIKKALSPGGKPNSTTKRAIAGAVAALDWARKEEPEASGLAFVTHSWWRELSVDWQAQKRHRAPEPWELARTLILLERGAEWPDEPLNVTSSVLVATKFICFTGQRDGAAVQLKRADIFDHPDEPGWKIAHWPAEAMKGKGEARRAHAVPIPPLIADMLEELWRGTDQEFADSPWAFPGGTKAGHVGQSAVNGLFRRMRGGKRYFYKPLVPHYHGKPGPRRVLDRTKARPDLLTAIGVEDWTMHDARRSVTNFLANAGHGSAASAILAHVQELRLPMSQERPEEMMARTTSRHYFSAQQIPLKTAGMALWSEALQAAIDEQTRAAPDWLRL